MSSTEAHSWVRAYYPSFDGLRALAISAVYICHFGQFANRHLSPSLWWAGVDLFFVLSGFLITGILYESKEQPHYFRNFYLRRALRILPLYWGLFIALGGVQVLFRHEFPHHLWISLLFLQNLFLRGIYLGHVHNVTIFATRYGVLGLGPLWSLCVEEQFYMLWPMCVYFFPSRHTLLRISLGATLAVLFVRCAVYAMDPVARQTGYLYSQPYARFDSLLIGAALNLALRECRMSRVQLRRCGMAVLLGSGLVLVTVLEFVGGPSPFRENSPGNQTVGFTLVALCAAAVLLLSLDPCSRFGRFLASKPLRQLGKVSYGFYFFHCFFAPLAIYLRTRLPSIFHLLILPAIFAVCYLTALLSYRYWEEPFLRLKKRLAPSAKSTSPPIYVFPQRSTSTV